jgi:hypothetical protein
VNTFLAMLTGALLRIGLPVALTVLGILMLRRLDARWQKENAARPLPVVDKPECWKAKGCPEEQRAACPGYASAGPCWQAFRKPDGTLQEKCLACAVFRQAPVPA